MSNEDSKLIDATRASQKDGSLLRSPNKGLIEAAKEPIAIVAMSCRLPGGVQSPRANSRSIEASRRPASTQTSMYGGTGWILE